MVNVGRSVLLLRIQTDTSQPLMCSVELPFRVICSVCSNRNRELMNRHCPSRAFSGASLLSRDRASNFKNPSRVSYTSLLFVWCFHQRLQSKRSLANVTCDSKCSRYSFGLGINLLCTKWPHPDATFWILSFDTLHLNVIWRCLAVNTPVKARQIIAHLADCDTKRRRSAQFLFHWS